VVLTLTVEAMYELHMLKMLAPNDVVGRVDNDSYADAIAFVYDIHDKDIVGGAAVSDYLLGGVVTCASQQAATR